MWFYVKLIDLSYSIMKTVEKNSGAAIADEPFFVIWVQNVICQGISVSW